MKFVVKFGTNLLTCKKCDIQYVDEIIIFVNLRMNIHQKK